MKTEDLLFQINMIISENIFPNKRMQAVKEMVNQLITENQELAIKYAGANYASGELAKRIKELEQQLEEQKELVEKLKTMLDEYIQIGDIRTRSIHNLIHEIRETFDLYRE